MGPSHRPTAMRHLVDPQKTWRRSVSVIAGPHRRLLGSDGRPVHGCRSLQTGSPRERNSGTVSSCHRQFAHRQLPTRRSQSSEASVPVSSQAVEFSRPAGRTPPHGVRAAERPLQGHIQGDGQQRQATRQRQEVLHHLPAVAHHKCGNLPTCMVKLGTVVIERTCHTCGDIEFLDETAAMYHQAPDRAPEAYAA